MRGIVSLRKSAIAVAVCLAVLCLPGYSEPTPEQVKERTELLVEAIRNNNVEQAKLCIKLGADVNATIYGYVRDRYYYTLTTNKNLITCSEFDVYTIPTLAMASESNKDIMELIIKSGADINAKSDNTEPLLIYAAEKKGWKDIIELLIKAGADINTKGYHGQTALINAAYKGHKDTAEVLIKAGADINAKTNDGWTALMNAAYYDHKDIAELLIKAGADVNARTDNGGTALMMAAENNKKKDVAEVLIKAGADSGSALIEEIKHKFSSAAKLLINAGADVNATDSEGLTALTCAILYGQNDIAELLKAAGAKE
ncbi:MAG: ankyrin repeat domain-containing protein [Treponemataceae bacterium]|nr:ankyrin repeat domain-containing protein [Treponemataceae bacterium]